jgi:hypothetical protein
LAKAAQFYDMADLTVSGEAWDASVSLAVSAAINASDVICLLETGVIPAGDAHASAASILKRTGHLTASTHLLRALAVKTRAQYGTARCTEREARETLKHADRLLREATGMSKKGDSE